MEGRGLADGSAVGGGETVVERVGECAFLLGAASAAEALALYERVTAAAPEAADVIPGAETVLVVFSEPPTDEVPARLAAIEREGASGAHEHRAREHAIAVHYDGPDLERVAAHAGLTAAETIARHASARYRVAFVGFQPGFGYLSGLPDELATPRLPSPRAKIPAGSVAIGGTWSGVYPSESPGGWNLIGRADVLLFDPAAAPPARLSPGDVVRFVPR